MPSDALAQIIETMRQGGPDLSAPPEQARAVALQVQQVDPFLSDDANQIQEGARIEVAAVEKADGEAFPGDQRPEVG